MSDSPKAEFGKPSLTPHEMEQMLDQVDMLVSELLDDVISEQRFTELEQMLESSGEARERYVQGMQLHSDLIDHFQPERKSQLTEGGSPILGMLGSEGFETGGAGPIVTGDHSS